MDSSTTSTERRIALLIDGDNISPDYIQYIIPELGKYGVVVSRRVYGDFSQKNLESWRDVCLTFAIRPIHQFRNQGMKNTTDIALVIDAMDALNTVTADGLCIASNDGDFTGLIGYLRDKGRYVIGVGTQNAARVLQVACDRFIYIENLMPQEADNNLIATPDDSKNSASQTPIISDVIYSSDPLDLLLRALSNSSGETGWANLAALGEKLRALDPAFDSRTYGYNQLHKLVRAYDGVFELSYRGPNKEQGTTLYVRRIPQAGEEE